MKKLYSILFAFVFVGTTGQLTAQIPGDPDSTFNTEDQGYLLGPGINDMLVQPDGKLLIGGSFGATCNRGQLARLGANDKKYDETFNAGGSGVTGGSLVAALALQPNGKIIIGGTFTDYNGVAANTLARLLPDGTLDNTFIGRTTQWNSDRGEIVLQSDGKIILVGNISSYDGNPVNNIVRVNTDGSYDNTFTPGTGANGIISSAAVQADDKIVIAGSFTSYDGNLTNYICRLNANGSFDNTFITGTGFNYEVTKRNNIVIQSTGKIIVGGGVSINLYNGNWRPGGFNRLNTDGTFDATFNSGGSGPGSPVGTLIAAVQDGGLALVNDDKLFIIGNFETYNGVANRFLVKLNVDGSLDNSFYAGYVNHYFQSIAVGNGGRPIVYYAANWLYNASGSNYVYRNYLTRYSAIGEVEDLSSGTGPGSNVKALTVQNDGKILVGGSFYTYNGTVVNGIARTNTDGSRDTSFHPGSTYVPSPESFFTTNRGVLSIAVQADDKILIATSGMYSGSSVMRLNGSDGSLDGTFTSYTFNYGGVNSMAIQNDDKIIIGGTFYNLGNDTSLGRLNVDGTFDPTFTGHFIPGAPVNCLAIQSDGKIVAAGGFTSYQGVAVGNIVRVNSDGSLDNTFNPTGVGANGGINSIKIQSDGKIIIGGEFYTYNGVAKGKIARLNADGSLDNTFSGAGFDYWNGDWISSMILQQDGKIITGGRLSTYNGKTIHQIVRINTDGSLDCSFYPGSGFTGNPAISSLALQGDGNIIAGGNPTTCSYNGSHKNGLYRIIGGNYNSNLGLTIPSTDVPCFGGTNGLATATPSGGTSPFSYAWTGPSFTSTAQNITVPIGTYTVQVTDAAGCNTTSNVTINEPVVLTAGSVSSASVCLGSGVSIGGNPTVSGGTANYTYTWTNGSMLNDNTIANPIASPTTPTTFDLTVTDANGCVATASTTVYINSLPDATTNLNGITISANLAGAGYQWLNCDSGNSIIANATNQSYTPTANGNYSVIVTLNSCSDTSACVTINTVGVAENSNANKFNVFPNPTNGKFTIEVDGLKSQQSTAELDIYNVLGAKVYSQKNQNQKTLTLNLDVPNGVYFISIKSGEQNYYQKLIKQ